jgi:hypothetical protein
MTSARPETGTRALSGDNPDGLGQTADVNLDSLSVRVSLSF